MVNADFSLIFTDGHAKNQVTRFFRERADLLNLDWTDIKAMTWYNTPDNPDRMRRKQAECLVLSAVPPQYITALVVFDAPTQHEMLQLVAEKQQTISVHVNPNSVFYY